MKITNVILNNKIEYINATLNTGIVNRNYNNYEHLMLNGENIFVGTKKECADFLDGLANFYKLAK